MPKPSTKRIRITVVPAKERWAVRQAGIAAVPFETKAPAVAYAVKRGRALWAGGQRAEVVIHGRIGQIQDRRTYGADPVRHKG